MTVKVFPAAVIVPLRAPPAFAATVNDTVPLPVPVLPPDIVIHGTLAAAVHAHVAADAVTAIDPDPPVSETVWLSGPIENVHGGGGGGVGAAA